MTKQDGLYHTSCFDNGSMDFFNFNHVELDLELSHANKHQKNDKNNGVNARIPILSQTLYCPYKISRVLLGTYFIMWWHILNASSRYHISRIMNLRCM
jgi:hypothetical protein